MLLTNIFVITAAVFNIIAKFVSSFELLMAGRFLGGIFTGLFTGVV